MRREMEVESNEWRTQAKCKGQDEVFFPNATPNSHTVNGDAMRICSECPVQKPCMEYGMELLPEGGTWGGLGPRSLHRARHLRFGNIPIDKIPHGTPLRYFYFDCRCEKCKSMIPTPFILQIPEAWSYG